MSGELNAWLFMAINMTIVFGVLIALWVLMVIIHAIDPTKAKKKSAEPVKTAAPASASAAAPAATSQDEVVAVITAAIMSMGYSSGQVASIRPAKNTGWTAAARISAVDTY